MVPRNIYEQQAANKRNTMLVMAAFVLFIGLLGLGFDAYMLGFPDGVRFPFVTVLAVGLGTMSAVWSLESGAKTVLASSTAEPIIQGDPRYQQLFNVADEMAIASGLPRPTLYLVPDPDPNAFATGKDPEHASIAVTQGLLDQLSRDELQAVIAHEMSHVRNYDIRLMTVVAALIGTVSLLWEFGLRSMSYGAGRKSSSKGKGGGNAIFFILWLVILILAPFISRILAMAVSRQREYLADASGAELTRNPGALVSALEKLDSAIDPTRAIKKGTAHLCIVDPLGAEGNDSEGFLADLFATHPPMKNRITLLKAMAYQQSGVIHK